MGVILGRLPSHLQTADSAAGPFVIQNATVRLYFNSGVNRDIRVLIYQYTNALENIIYWSLSNEYFLKVASFQLRVVIST